MPRGRLANYWFARGYHRVANAQRRWGTRIEVANWFFGSALRVSIDPARLNFQLLETVSAGPEHVRLAHWFLDGGDWSQILFPLIASPVRAEVDALFDHEHNLEDAPAFRSLLHAAEQGIPQRRNSVELADVDTIRAYFAHYRALKDSVERFGFRSRDDLPTPTAGLFNLSPIRGRRAERLEHEIGLAVGHDGTVMRIVGGHHRTAIAQRLNLKRIPAQVRLVHVDWLRAWIARTGASPSRALMIGLEHL